MKDTNSTNRNRIPRTLLYYYGIAMLAVFLFNWLFVPLYASRQVQTTSYSDFIAAVEAGDVEQVHFTDTQINYTKEEGGKILFQNRIVDNLPFNFLEKEELRSRKKPNVFLSLLLNYVPC